jgi:two-component system, NarL family, sensor histidine kinase DesK
VLLVVFSAVAGSPVINGAWVPVVIAVVGLGLGLFALWRGRTDRLAYEAELVRRGKIEAVAAERLGLARDLHDIVSHGLGFITTRAAVSRHLAKADTSDALQALSDIEAASRQATSELRRMLTVLRGDTRAPLGPLPGLGAITGLVTKAERNGLRVRYEHDTDLRMSGGAEVTVFRIVQEALTNIARHVGPTDVHIACDRHGDLIAVSIEDSGSTVATVPQPGTGHGLQGLRERVEALEGTFTADQTAGGGFRIVAQIPDSVSDRNAP